MKCTIQKQRDCYLPYDEESVDLTSRKKDGALFVVAIKPGKQLEQKGGLVAAATTEVKEGFIGKCSAQFV